MKKTDENQEIRLTGNLPTIMPIMDKKELFNTLQEGKPLEDLIGIDFKITGIYPEMVEVPNVKDKAELERMENEGEDIPTVERLRVTLLTDVGVFNSYSKTFNGSLNKAINVFDKELSSLVFNISTRTKDKKVYYIVKVK